MKIANKLAKTMNRSEAMRRAWAIVKMMFSKSSNEVEKFTFTKDNGEERQAEGFLRNAFTSKAGAVVIGFVQLDGGFRSFRADRLNIN